jgi:hypothetical protein
VSIPRGAAAMFIKAGTLKRELVRCADCAGEAPPDLPDLVEPETLEQKLTRIAANVPMRSFDAEHVRREWMPHKDE